MMRAERGAAVNTVAAYQRDLRDLFEFLAEHLQLQPTDASSLPQITPESLETYVAHLSQLQHRSTTIARKVAACRQFWSFLHSEGVVSTNPTTYIERPPLTRPLPKLLTAEDTTKILNYVRHTLEDTPYNRRLRAIIEILCASGLRVSECAALPLAALGQLKEAPVLTIKGKGGKEGIALLHSTAIAALENYLQVRQVFVSTMDQFKTSAATNENNPIYHPVTSNLISLSSKNYNPWLFPAPTRTGYITRHSIGLQLKEVAIACDIDSAKISPHYLRHGFATNLLAKGADLLSVKKLLRHQDISTTQIYLHVVNDRINELVQNYHPLAGNGSKRKTGG